VLDQKRVNPADDSAEMKELKGRHPQWIGRSFRITGRFSRFMISLPWINQRGQFWAMDPLIDYYSQRAPEYEEIYRRNDPVRQAEITEIGQIMRSILLQKRVLEVACGTGFWTQIVAEVARTALAIDASEQMLTLARKKIGTDPRVRFEEADAYKLETLQGDFDAGLAMFWFSHIPRVRLQEFLTGFHRRLGPSAVVFMGDNVDVPGVGGELVRPADSKDSFKIRQLQDGSTHRIIKNYYDESELRQVLGSHCANLEVHFGTAYWWVRYEVAASNHDATL
jgi:ubiquinone/menaquinone biosynthesis C-methylase UbiE